MQKYAWYCPHCVKENDKTVWFWEPRYAIPGFYVTFDNEPENEFCWFHTDQPLIKSEITIDEIKVLRKVSIDPNFIMQMNELKKTDPIEYQARISQFRTNIMQQESMSGKCCPHCHSRNIVKISMLNRATSISLFGIFSKKINKTYECKNCGYTW